MKLFLIGIIIGIGKIIPGVSGAILAINFKVYDKIINALCNLKNKDNFKYLIIIGSGIMIAIILGSKIILYLLNNYYFMIMMFFIGLMLGGTLNFSKSIDYNKKKFILLGIILLISFFFLIINIKNTYVLSNTFKDNIMMFLGGIIEVISSIIPGISGTVLNMILGIYDLVLLIISNMYNINYVIDNINLYIYYGLGMFISLVMSIIFINNIINKYKNTFFIFVLGFSLSSLLFLLINVFKYNFNFIELIIGIILMILGNIISFKLNGE